jgi:hypothetical protein
MALCTHLLNLRLRFHLNFGEENHGKNEGLDDCLGLRNSIS